MLHKIQEEFQKVHFDYAAVAVIDFKSHAFISHELKKVEHQIVPAKNVYFDLASLTKPLTLPVHYLKHPEIFGEKEWLLLNHRAGLPSGGRISREKWREHISSYKIYESSVLYSDYSALRLMLELGPKLKRNFQKECADYWAKDVYFWKELPQTVESPVTGYRGGREICGVVHDDNTFVINEFCSHAGLFSTVAALAKTLIGLEQNHGLLSVLKAEEKKDKGKNRFVMGFDRVEDPEKTLAGQGASLSTFGHLGFTGTSFWIDLEKAKGTVLLTNGVRGHWHSRDELNSFRRSVGEVLWKS